MPPAPKPSIGAIVAIVVLGAAIALLWFLQLSALTSLTGSDAAGNAMSQGFAALLIVVLWLLLAVLAIVAVVKGAVPWPAWVAALILIPASSAAALGALDLLARPSLAPFTWPLIVPAAVPPLVVIFCLWALLPAVRAVVPAILAGGIVWGATLLLCLSVLPMQHMRELAIDQEAAASAKYSADFASVPADAPLWEWTPFLTSPSETLPNTAIGRIRRLDRRQSDAEIMLERGDFPLGYLGSLDLDPTPALCDKARDLLRRRAAALVPPKSETRPYAAVAKPLSDALAAMKWLVGYDCPCDAESLAWEAVAKAHGAVVSATDTFSDLYLLAGLRDPKNLGRTLREDPARFSMLTPKAHLKAWLKYADDEDLRERALAGARKLDHRTTDAVEMLADGGYFSTTLMLLRYLPELDLEATQPLCVSALRVLAGEFGKIYRPGADDPQPYSELLKQGGRGDPYQWGKGDPFADLIWLARHGCAAEAQVSQAESLVQSYQDSPERAAMLATLAELHRKP